jgi:phenylpyruvate tautomerase PptA (4-oxalocrotonate tautomerase family)
MPLARIDVPADATPEFMRAVGDAVYNAMADVASVPKNDRFQIFNRHAPGEIVYPEEGYLGVQYTNRLIIIQVTWVAGRSTDVKKAFYRRVADDIHQATGTRKEDIFISLVDVQREDWSFGNGEMQYAPPAASAPD